VVGLLDKNVSYHTSPSGCVKALVCVCVCVCVCARARVGVCIRALCSVHTETLNGPSPKFSRHQFASRQDHRTLHLATSMCVEKGWSSAPAAPSLVTNHWEIILKDDVSQRHKAINDIVLYLVKSRDRSNNNNNTHSVTRPQFFKPP